MRSGWVARPSSSTTSANSTVPHRTKSSSAGLCFLESQSTHISPPPHPNTVARHGATPMLDPSPRVFPFVTCAPPSASDWCPREFKKPLLVVGSSDGSLNLFHDEVLPARPISSRSSPSPSHSLPFMKIFHCPPPSLPSTPISHLSPSSPPLPPLILLPSLTPLNSSSSGRAPGDGDQAAAPSHMLLLGPRTPPPPGHWLGRRRRLPLERGD